MTPNLAFDFCRVTEGAALAAYLWLGRGDKNKADAAAVEAMRLLLNQIQISAEIVIGEGEIDEAPMLFIGEKLGLGGEAIDIAVDPIDGTRMLAMGQSGAVSVLAASNKGGLLTAPDMYMEKLVVGSEGKNVIDLNKPLIDNVKLLAKVMDKPLSQMTVAVLAKPRHDNIIKELHRVGVRVFSPPDGDVAASLLACMPESTMDMMYGIGGAPEGIISAAAVRALGGSMQARLVPRTAVKGDDDSQKELERIERERCIDMGVEIDTVLPLEALVKFDDVMFSMTGITNGELVEGVFHDEDYATTETIVVSGFSGTFRRIHSTHYLDQKTADAQDLVR